MVFVSLWLTNLSSFTIQGKCVHIFKKILHIIIAIHKSDSLLILNPHSPHTMRTLDMSNFPLIMLKKRNVSIQCQFMGECRDFLNMLVCCYRNMHFVTNFMVGCFNVTQKCMIVISDDLERQAMHTFWQTEKKSAGKSNFCEHGEIKYLSWIVED